MVWVRSERALANSSTCRAPPAAMLRSSSQNTRLRMGYRRLLGGKPLSQAIGEVCPAEPLFNKAPSNGCHADLPVRIVQEYQHRLSQCGRIVRRNQGDSGLLKKRGGDRGDRAGDHGPSAGKVIKDFDRRRFAPVPTERSHTERHGTNPRDRKSTRLNSSHLVISYAVFCLKKKKKRHTTKQ